MEENEVLNGKVYGKIDFARELISETEEKIIATLSRSLCSGRIDEDEFKDYELKEIKKLLFMINELDDKIESLKAEII